MKQGKLSKTEKARRLRESQENYRHRIRRFTFQFSLKDSKVRDWFEQQPDKGAYLKMLIQQDKDQKRND